MCVHCMLAWGQQDAHKLSAIRSRCVGRKHHGLAGLASELCGLQIRHNSHKPPRELLRLHVLSQASHDLARLVCAQLNFQLEQLFRVGLSLH